MYKINIEVHAKNICGATFVVIGILLQKLVSALITALATNKLI